jgi:hypothetical protein
MKDTSHMNSVGIVESRRIVHYFVGKSAFILLIVSDC